MARIGDYHSSALPGKKIRRGTICLNAYDFCSGGGQFCCTCDPTDESAVSDGHDYGVVFRKLLMNLTEDCGWSHGHVGIGRIMQKVGIMRSRVLCGVTDRGR